MQIEYEVKPEFFSHKNQSGVRYTKSTGIKSLPGREKMVRLIWQGKTTEAYDLLVSATESPVAPTPGKYSNFPLLARMRDAGLLATEALGPRNGQRFTATQWGKTIIADMASDLQPQQGEAQ